MVLGFNHNIMYKGEVFHVQTEDSGRANPHIITLLYRGGTIIASAKTSYADIIKVDQLEAVVESIMKEQHKQMMRRLKDGEFDSRIFPNSAAAPQSVDAPTAVAMPAPPVPPAAAVEQPIQNNPVSPAAGGYANPATAAAKSPLPSAPPVNPVKRSLDEVILDYLITGEDK